MREVRPEQLWNIFDMYVTAEVSKLDKSREVSPWQPSNILLISVTDEVLKLDKSMEARSPQL